MAGVRFIRPEATVNAPEKEPQSQRELRRRLCQAKDRYRAKKKLHDDMLEEAKETDNLIKELTAENKYLTSRVNKLTQVLENHREKRCSVYMRQMETENKKLREENERLAAKLDRRDRNQKEIKTLRRTEQELKHTLGEILDDLYTKDKKIKENSLILAQKNSELWEHYDTVQDLRRKMRILEVRLSRQKKQALLCQRNLQEGT